MKSFFVFLPVLVVFFLAGCGQKTTLKVSFDNYSFDFVTTESYQGVSLPTEGSRGPSSLIKSYTEQNKTGYMNSLLVTKVNMKGVALVDFINENLGLVKKNYSTYNFEAEKHITFDCSGVIINGRGENFYIVVDNNQNIYFGQYYFLTEKEGYILSFSSDRKNSRDNFSSSLNSLVCK